MEVVTSLVQRALVEIEIQFNWYKCLGVDSIRRHGLLYSFNPLSVLPCIGSKSVGFQSLIAWRWPGAYGFNWSALGWLTALNFCNDLLKVLAHGCVNRNNIYIAWSIKSGAKWFVFMTRLIKWFFCSILSIAGEGNVGHWLSYTCEKVSIIIRLRDSLMEGNSWPLWEIGVY